MNSTHFPAPMLSFVLLLAAGCAALGEMGGDRPSSGRIERDTKGPLTLYEPTLNPSDFDEEVEEVRKAHDEQKPIPDLEIPQDSLVVVEENIQGFRVQVFASANIDDANAARIAVTEKFRQDSVYLVYDPPVYKIRVGDYTTRLEASRKLTLIADRGYPDAWVVADRVVQRRIVRMAPAPVPEKEEE